MKGLIHEVGRGVQGVAALVVIASLAPGVVPAGLSSHPAAAMTAVAHVLKQSAPAEPRAAPADAVAAGNPLVGTDIQAEEHAEPPAPQPRRAAIGFDLPGSTPNTERRPPAFQPRVMPPQAGRQPWPDWLPHGPFGGLPVEPPAPGLGLAHDEQGDALGEPEDVQPTPELLAEYWRRDIDRFRYMAQTGYTNAGIKRAFGDRYEFVQLVAVSNVPLDRLPRPPVLYVRALLQSDDFRKFPVPSRPSARIIRGTAIVPRYLPPPQAPPLRSRRTRTHASH